MQEIAFTFNASDQSRQQRKSSTVANSPLRKSNAMLSNEYRFYYELKGFKMLTAQECELVKLANQLKYEIPPLTGKSPRSLKNKKDKFHTSTNLSFNQQFNEQYGVPKQKTSQAAITPLQHKTQFANSKELAVSNFASNNSTFSFYSKWQEILEVVYNSKYQAQIYPYYKKYVQQKCEEQQLSSKRIKRIRNYFEEAKTNAFQQIKEKQEKIKKQEEIMYPMTQKAKTKYQEMQKEISELKNEVREYQKIVAEIKENKIKVAGPQLYRYKITSDEIPIQNENESDNKPMNINIRNSTTLMPSSIMLFRWSRMRKQEEQEECTPFEVIKEDEQFAYLWFLESIENFIKEIQNSRITQETFKRQESFKKQNKISLCHTIRQEPKQSQVQLDDLDQRKSKILKIPLVKTSVPSNKFSLNPILNKTTIKIDSKRSSSQSSSLQSHRQNNVSNNGHKINVANLGNCVRDIIERLKEKIKYEQELIFQGNTNGTEDSNLNILNEETNGKIILIQKILRYIKNGQFEKVQLIADLDTFLMIDQELAEIVNHDLPQIKAIVSYKKQMRDQLLQQKHFENQRLQSSYMFQKPYEKLTLPYMKMNRRQSNGLTSENMRMVRDKYNYTVRNDYHEQDQDPILAHSYRDDTENEHIQNISAKDDFNDTLNQTKTEKDNNIQSFLNIQNEVRDKYDISQLINIKEEQKRNLKDLEQMKEMKNIQQDKEDEKKTTNIFIQNQQNITIINQSSQNPINISSNLKNERFVNKTQRLYSVQNSPRRFMPNQYFRNSVYSTKQKLFTPIFSNHKRSSYLSSRLRKQ